MSSIEIVPFKHHFGIFVGKKSCMCAVGVISGAELHRGSRVFGVVESCNMSRRTVFGVLGVFGLVHEHFGRETCSIGLQPVPERTTRLGKYLCFAELP